MRPCLLAIAVAVASPLALMAESGLVSVLDESPALMMHSSPGYLGVTLHDVDAGRAGELKLNNLHGAEVVMIDHDAPACKAGIKLHDVIVQMNGQAIDNVDQLRKLLHDAPVGRTVAFTIQRDGQQVALSVQLGDRVKITQEAIFNQYSVPEPSAEAENSAWAPLANQQDGEYGAGFFGSLNLNPLYVGVVLDPVGAQLADYFGVKNGTGLLVKRVDDNSPAGAAGMKAGDVVLEVNGQTMASSGNWLRAVRVNRGRQVQVTIIRNRKQETLVMTAGVPKGKG